MITDKPFFTTPEERNRVGDIQCLTRGEGGAAKKNLVKRGAYNETRSLEKRNRDLMGEGGF